MRKDDPPTGVAPFHGVLVTGATGKVGSRVVARLAASGDAVRVLATELPSRPLAHNVEVVFGDAGDPAGARSLCMVTPTVVTQWAPER